MKSLIGHSKNSKDKELLFACKTLVEISQETDPTIIVTAKTKPEHNASTKILANNGFSFREIVQDHEIGDAWFWVLDN